MVPKPFRSAARKNWLRLDALLVKRGLAESRTRAQALVLSATVRVGGKVVTKAGSHVAPDAEISVGSSRERTFVSRASEKLNHALDAFWWRCKAANASMRGPPRADSRTFCSGGGHNG